MKAEERTIGTAPTDQLRYPILAYQRPYPRAPENRQVWTID